MSSAFEEGRSAHAEALAAALPGASRTFLDGALGNPALGPDLLPLLFKNPRVTPQQILRVAQNRDWLKTYEIRAAIVLHPKTPRVIAMNLISHLWWRDLARVVDRPGLSPPLRRTAERVLAIRIQELAVGERISLARIASRGVINALRGDPNPMVSRALLQNPRLVEEDALAIAARRRTPSAILHVLAEDHRWSARPPVRKAIARHPATPAQVALRMIRDLSRRDLKEVASSPHVPGLVRVAIGRMLNEEGAREASVGASRKRSIRGRRSGSKR